MSDKSTLPPPRSFRGALAYLGPGLIISAALVGSGELVATTRLGAEVGFTLLWLIIVGCVLKVFVQIEIATYAISSGETTLTAFNRIPGPRARANWVVWIWLIAIASAYAMLGGIIGGIVQAIALGFDIPQHWMAVVMVLFTIAVLVLGKYRGIEATATWLVVFFTVITLGTAVAIQATPFAVSMAEIGSGLTFQLPETDGALTIALAAFGLIGVTASDIVGYPYWCVEKGYARYAGPADGDAGWVDRARGWIRVMRIDAFTALVIYTTATLAFYVIGAAVLHPQGLDPNGVELITTLIAAYAPVFGSLAKWLLIAGAIVVLYSSYLVAMGTSARTFTDFFTVLGLVDRNDANAVQRSISRMSVVLPLVTLGFYLTGINPVGLIMVGGISQALFLPVVTLSVLYLRYRVTDPRLRPGRAWDAALLISCACFVAIGLFSIVRLLGIPS
jgi:Mn2+/Fe2+ NRAMP family transporter